jgi:hypothetical protein
VVTPPVNATGAGQFTSMQMLPNGRFQAAFVIEARSAAR